MPTTATAELYFIAGAFVLILVICAVTVFVFFRQLKRERDVGDTNEFEDQAENGDRQEEE